MDRFYDRLSYILKSAPKGFNKAIWNGASLKEVLHYRWLLAKNKRAQWISYRKRHFGPTFTPDYL